MCWTALLLDDRVVDRQHRAAGIAEDVLDALVGERLDDHLGAGHLGPVPRGLLLSVRRVLPRRLFARSSSRHLTPTLASSRFCQ